MFGLSKKKSVVGIDIGSKATKVVQLAYNGTDHPALENCGMIKSGILDEGFAGNLKKYLKENHYNNAMIASSIDDASMKIRKMELPKMPHHDLIEAIKWNLRDIVDGNIDEFTISYSRISETTGEESAKIDLMAYAIKKEAVENYKLLIEGMGIHPFFIEPAAVSLASTLERCVNDDDNYIAGVNVGYKSSIFYVVGKGVFVFSRPMIGINLEAQEKDKEGFNQKLAIEIQKSIDTFKVNFKMEEISELYLSGGGALIPNISEYLSTNMGLDSKILNPFQTLSETDRFMEGIKPELFAQAVGLAYLLP